MFKRYNTDQLFTATIRNIFVGDYIKSNGKRTYKVFKFKRKGIVYKDGDHIYDIMRPEEDVNEVTLFHRTTVDDMQPLYGENVHKVVSKRQAFKRYKSLQKKLTKNS